MTEEQRAVTLNDLAPFEPGLLSMGPFVMTETGLQIQGEPTFEEWEGYGAALFGFRAYVDNIGHYLQWAIADWANWGQGRFGENFAQAIGYSKGYVSSLKRLGEKIPAERRNAEVPPTTHYEVANLPPEDQVYWLSRCAEGDGDGRPWTKARLHDEIQEDKGNGFTKTVIVVRARAVVTHRKDAKPEEIMREALFGARFPYLDGDVVFEDLIDAFYMEGDAIVYPEKGASDESVVNGS